MALEQLADGVHVLAAPFRFLGIVGIGTRMTVLRMRDGGVLVHSPVPLDDATAQAVDAIGPVRWIVAPNLFHHLFVGPARERWPEARLVAPAALAKKRSDLRVDVELGAPPAEWKDDVTPIRVRGTLLGETVLFHEASRTLVSADLIENFVAAPDALTGAYLRLGGVHGRPGWHRFLRFVYRDRGKARASVEEILERDLARVVVAHGDPITDAPKETLREGLAFLLR